MFRIAAKYGRLDALAYNAGVAIACDADIANESKWDTVMNTNLKSAFYMIEKVLPELAKVKGNVVVTSSLAGIFHPVQPPTHPLLHMPQARPQFHIW